MEGDTAVQRKDESALNGNGRLAGQWRLDWSAPEVLKADLVIKACKESFMHLLYPHANKRDYISTTDAHDKGVKFQRVLGNWMVYAALRIICALLGLDGIRRAGQPEESRPGENAMDELGMTQEMADEGLAKVTSELQGMRERVDWDGLLRLDEIYRGETAPPALDSGMLVVVRESDASCGSEHHRRFRPPRRM
jgi:hypothetical protein